MMNAAAHNQGAGAVAVVPGAGDGTGSAAAADTGAVATVDESGEIVAFHGAAGNLPGKRCGWRSGWSRRGEG